MVGALQAINAATGNQTTTYNYETTLTDSDVATSLLLSSVAYPDSVSGSDQVFFTYNRQAQRISLTDQNGSVHAYDYDLLGRLTEDCITTLGTGVDSAIQRIEWSYEVRGMVNRVTSHNSPTVGSGSIVNDVQWNYNNFGQSIQTYQSHSGAVNTSTTASVQMGYADGSANTIRLTTLTYPNGRVVMYDYGTSGGITDSVSQIASLIDSDMAATHLADYSYLGLEAIVEQESTQADLLYTLVSLTGSDDPVTGDIYTGLDLFSRIKDSRWLNTSTTTDLSRIQYGYDQASSRIWRLNTVAPSENYDWLYDYDGLHRVTYGDRGTLNWTQTAITDSQFAQCWTLDSTGNWSGFRQDDTGGGTWDLVQSRSANPVNEITGITNTLGSSWVTPAYDANGNMTTIPQPADPANSFNGKFDAWNRLVSLVDNSTKRHGSAVPIRRS